MEGGFGFVQSTLLYAGCGTSITQKAKLLDGLKIYSSVIFQWSTGLVSSMTNPHCPYISYISLCGYIRFYLSINI